MSMNRNVVSATQLAHRLGVLPARVKQSARILVVLPAGHEDGEVFYDQADADAIVQHVRQLQAMAIGAEAEPLMRRDDQAERDLSDLTVRTIALRADSLDEKTRSVEAVIATEDRVPVMDLGCWEVIDEVLRMDGVELPEDMPLLADHNRWTIDAVLGSCRGFRKENGQLLARLYFAEGEPDSPEERAYRKVKGKHLRNVSVGYRVHEFVDIAAGQTQEVKGRRYTAGKRKLRIATRWEPRENSLVPIGADKRAKTRADVSVSNATSTRESAMNPKLRAFLESIGLRKDATDAEAQTAYNNLNAQDRGRADTAAAATETTRSEPAATTTVAPTQGLRNEPPSAPAATITAAATSLVPTLSAEAIRQEALERVRRINELAGDDVPRETVTRALNEGWDVNRASQEFLTAVRGSRSTLQPPGDPNYRPALHSRSHDADANVRSLGMALMLRENGSMAANLPAHYCEVLSGGTLRMLPNAAENQELVRAADNAWQFRRMSLVDLCREAVRLDGRTVPHDPEECIRAAVSGSTLSAIFTTNVSAQLMQGWSDAEDTTMGWCSEADVPNFLTNERAEMGKFGQLKKHSRGDTAPHLDTNDRKEEYKLARYSGQFCCDEMDIINDRFGAIEQTSPVDMGLTARQLRPNLVYSILLANAALADTVTLFHATHGNTTTGALTAATLQASITLMGKQRLGRTNDAAAKKRPLNIKPRFLIVPQDLAFAAEILLTSAMRVTGQDAGTKNPLLSRQIQLRVDDRIGANGCWDPVNETTRTGTATNYFLSARPGEEGAKTIEVGYRRGTGRAPQVRPYMLDRGQWGIGWDINLDIGAKALAHQGLLYSTGAP